MKLFLEPEIPTKIPRATNSPKKNSKPKIYKKKKKKKKKKDEKCQKNFGKKKILELKIRRGKILEN